MAGILVTLEDIVSGKLHFLLWQAVEKQEHNHLWDADLPRDGCYDLMLGGSGREIAPTVEVVGQEIIFWVGRNDLGMTLVKKGESAAGRTDIHRLPQAIQNQHLAIKQRLHVY